MTIIIAAKFDSFCVCLQMWEVRVQGNAALGYLLARPSGLLRYGNYSYLFVPSMLCVLSGSAWPCVQWFVFEVAEIAGYRN
jgi:hypothetical protein